MSSNPSTATSATLMNEIHEALVDFHQQCQQWERDFDSLFDELEILLGSDDEIGSPLLDFVHRMKSDNGRLLDRQEKISEEISDLRALVQRQGEGLSPPPSTRGDGASSSPTDGSDASRATLSDPNSSDGDPLVAAALGDSHRVGQD